MSDWNYLGRAGGIGEGHKRTFALSIPVIGKNLKKYWQLIFLTVSFVIVTCNQL